MARAVVYTLLATAFIIFIVFYPSNQRGHGHRLHLNRRLGYKFPNFDPLVIKMQRLAEEKGLSNETNAINLEKNSYAAEVEDRNKYYNNEGQLNITLRLIALFPFLDKAPKDGLVSFEELEAWNRELAIDRLTHTTQKEIESLDKDGDGAISFTEYLPQFSEEDIEKNEMRYGEAGWWKERFRKADVDQNGTLNFDEFYNFLHPEDSNNGELKKWVLREQIKRMDDDHDGKLSFAEFSKYTYNTYKSYAAFEISKSNVGTVQEKFAELDVNKDGFLEMKELIPMLSYLKPGELSYAKYFTNYLIHEADDNEDGYLNLDEMLNHEYTFYNTVYDDIHDDYDDFHDEL